MTSSPASTPLRASAYEASMSIHASGAPSEPCIGASATDGSAEEMTPIGRRSNRMLRTITAPWSHAHDRGRAPSPVDDGRLRNVEPEHQVEPLRRRGEPVRLQLWTGIVGLDEEVDGAVGFGPKGIAIAQGV